MKVLQSKQRLLKLNSKLADTLTSKGIQASSDETTTALVDKVSDISSDDDVLASLIDKTVESIVIPNSVTSIGAHAFNGCTQLKNITIPDSVTSIGGSAFTYCTSLTSITIPNRVKKISNAAFSRCTSLTSITIPNSVTYIDVYAFNGCTSLTSIAIPNSVTNIGASAFNGCTSLEFVELGQGFNANNPDLSASTKYTRETIVSLLNALADRTGQTAYKLIIGPANLKKLTQEDIAIATTKNWTIA